MTVVSPNSISGINSITVATGEALQVHAANGDIVSTIVSSSGIATYKAIHVGSGTTTSNQGVIVGTGASIVSDAVNELSIYTNNTERFNINSSGSAQIGISTFRILAGSAPKIGIGTYTPGYTIEALASSNPTLSIVDTTNAVTTQVRSNSTGGLVRTASNHPLVFATNQTERLRIDANGLIANGALAPSDYGSPNLLISGTDSTLTMMGNGSTNSTSFTGIKFRVAGGSTGDYTKAGIFSRREGGYNDLSLIVAMDTAADANSVAISDEKMRITSTGRVGIATDTPGAYLDIGDNLGSVPGFHLRNHPAAAPFENVYLAEIRHAYGSVKHACLIHAEEAADGRRSLDVSDSNGIFATFTNGKVGIHTELPGVMLHVVGNDGPTQATIGNSDTQLCIDNKGGNGAIIEFLTDNNSAGRLFFTDTDASNQGGIEYEHTGNIFKFRTAGAEKMRFGGTGSGAICWGNTGAGPHGGYFNIDASNSSTNGLNIVGTNGNYCVVSASKKTSGDHIYFSNYSSGSSSNTGTIQDNGSNVSYNTSSDYRLKENVVTISDGITRVKQLNPVRHTWKNNSGIGTVDGWIAHELDAVCPYAVTGTKDATNEDGSIAAQAVDYAKISPLLAAALKEAIAKIETLETKVAALESA